jgi:hypothetical protein
MRRWWLLAKWVLGPTPPAPELTRRVNEVRVAFGREPVDPPPPRSRATEHPH